MSKYRSVLTKIPRDICENFEEFPEYKFGKGVYSTNAEPISEKSAEFGIAARLNVSKSANVFNVNLSSDNIGESVREMFSELSGGAVDFEEINLVAESYGKYVV